VAVVLIREDLLERVSEGLPSTVDYKVCSENDSLYNTPPCFAIYMIMLVTKWLVETVGGLDKMAAVNKEKAKLLYDVIDASGGYYRGHAKPESRSLMNVTWRLPSEELEQAFAKQSTAAGLHGLKGHRSVGGLRASIYNAVGLDSVKALADFMKDFQRTNG
jgi:phosphoserine aminotransferase